MNESENSDGPIICKPRAGRFVQGNNVVIAIRFAMPIEWPELKETIIRRAVNAQTNEWMQTEKHLAGSEFA